ncbi:MAG TPA: ATP-binding cassette domain-containing protein [Labilithrix sp.]|nr:ATP-binding cassette domain-containing protein [Labilithrix sp.]
MTALALSRVTKTFAGREVIRETSLEVADGERLALIGPSGSGKSTLLRMILGLVVPDTGTVRVGDVTVTAGSARAARRRVGYVIQDGGLVPHLTARDNVTLVARLGRDLAPAQLTKRVAELAELVRLDDRLLDRHPRQLSGGERQRVGLMRALVLDPSLLLLDEPLGALDPIVRAGLQEDLRDVFEKLGKSVLIVTHDMAEAAYLARSIAVMRDGAVLQRGSIKELSAAPAHPFVAEFLGAQRSLTEALR